MAAIIASLLATLQMLLGVIGPHVVIERAAPAPVAYGTAGGDTACARWIWAGEGWRCPDNVWRVRIAPGVEVATTGDATTVADAADESPAALYRRALGLTTLVHELAHVYDGMDDGQFNGSPGHARPDDYLDALRLTEGRRAWEPSPWYCWSGEADDRVFPTDPSRGRAEWYACEVARTGTLR